MKKFYRKYFKRIWGILSGIIILVFAFVALDVTSNNNSYKKNTVDSTTEIKTTAKEAINVEETTEETSSYSKKDINLDSKYPYLIKINRGSNYTIVYAMDKNNEYSIPYKAFICSTGSNPMFTPLGEFTTSDMYLWREMVDGSYSQYAIRINGAIMLHSIPYKTPSKDTMKYKEYNKLGHAASLGCIRYQAKDIKWIYDNCPKGTTVIVYSDASEIPPLEIPAIETIDDDNPNRHWDPTDPDKDNPWKENNDANYQ